MNWRTLDKRIPFRELAPGGRLHEIAIDVYESVDGSVRVLLPGVHWGETKPTGGDFVVEVTTSTGSPGRWADHRFTHLTLFEDFAEKTRHDADLMRGPFARALIEVVAEGADPELFSAETEHDTFLPGLPVEVCR